MEYVLFTSQYQDHPLHQWVRGLRPGMTTPVLSLLFAKRAPDTRLVFLWWFSCATISFEFSNIWIICEICIIPIFPAVLSTAAIPTTIIPAFRQRFMVVNPGCLILGGQKKKPLHPIHSRGGLQYGIFRLIDSAYTTYLAIKKEPPCPNSSFYSGLAMVLLYNIWIGHARGTKSALWQL